ncbi:calcium-activated chloride channel regulator 2 [Gracilinanus agilis]|uniref:calcium-activated chloride channel regulator 2 n=1 Tax=Gracilinanus agilis TaxID=191870 RepID=UPI001CFCB15C|nr:calcium-activated chloride channel regulator 2 [Gracilinanus agilis]
MSEPGSLGILSSMPKRNSKKSLSHVSILKSLILLVGLSPELLLLGTSLQLQDNAYDGLLVAIHPRVSEDQNLVPKIMEMITEASSYLFNATKRRVYFGNVKILIPATWKAHNYSQAKQESYEKANIIIADWYRKHRDDPYTLQYGGCGEEGKYIHFTPNFLLNDNLTAIYGPRGRVFVHEWAHLRWGVFDEYNNEKPFYMAGHNRVKVTRCSSDLTGIFVCEKKTCTQENCIIHNLFKERCIFIHNNTQNTTASIMYMQSLSSVVEFCNSSTHNQDAPNLQNQMCSLRSTWDVIMDSVDLRQSSPLNVTALPSLPTFSLLQTGERVVCLVLDVSAKMAEADRLHRLHQAAEFYLLQVVETHTYVGIVSFSSRGMVKAQPLPIKNHQDRRQLSLALPTSVIAKNAEASVCSGLQMGLQVIESLHGNAYGSVIILATSGGDGDISNCLSTMVNSGSTVHTIALGPSVAENLEELSTLTGGLKFFASDRANSNGLIDAFSGISSGTGDVFHQPVQLDSTGEIVGVHQLFSRTVTVDGSLGNDTVFMVMWQTGGPPDMVLLSPGGKKYFTGDFNTHSGLRSSLLRIPEKAQTGHWTWLLNNTHSSPRALRVAVSSRASDHAVPPITVTAHVNKDGTRFPHPVIIYADVKQGFYPILEAKVTAVVEPDAGEPVRLELFDDGAGADIIKNDGIYSRYFFSFTVNGRYSLKVHVYQESHSRRLPHFIPGSYAMYVPGYIVNGNIQMNAPKKSTGDSDIQMQKWGFNRTTSGGSFSVLDVPAGPHADVFPPCRIINLEAIRKEEEIILTWSAPGDDFDQGQAASYEVRMSKSLQKIKDDFGNTILVNVSQLIPQRASSREMFVFTPALLTKEQQHELDEEAGEGNRVYLAIRAVDEASLWGQVSNIVQAALVVPQNVSPVTARESLILKGVLTAIGLIMTICFMICLAHCTLSRKKRSRKKANSTKLL